MNFTRAIFFCGFITLSLTSCKQSGKPSDKDIVKKPELLEDRIKTNLRETLEYAITHQSKINDSTAVMSAAVLQKVYNKSEFNPIWTNKGQFNILGDSLYNFILNAKHYGLFPSDYHSPLLTTIHQQLKSDTMASKDAALLSRTDLLLTDALMNIGLHLKRGRLPYDSLTTRKDTLVIGENFYLDLVNKLVESRSISASLNALEPTLPGYQAIKAGLKDYIDTTEFRRYTYLKYPFTDSIAFYADLKTRLTEEELFDSLPPATMDSAQWKSIITKYQAAKKLKKTGRVNENTIKSLNNTNWEKYKRAAISLDKYRLMADTMPDLYTWVNLPSFYLKVIECDTQVMQSRVIVGATKTRSPELYSEISNFITFPQWTVPYSIIFKEMLPQIQKDTNYLAKQNLMVVDKNDSVIAPSLINWKKLNKNYFPYLIKQRQGDDNSLGVLKFNFRNKYAVYLHDTNARWMFSKTDRALSHGCIRVQDWKDLAYYLVRNDTVKYHPDTLANWILRQEKHVVSGFKKMPLFIRYFTVEGVNGKIRFYDDIYAEDKLLAEQYYSKNP